MDQISNLIKEAKPLYFKQKRNKRNMKIILCSMLLMFVAGGATLTSLNVKTSSIVAQYNTSYIEEIGLPVDEYGLLTVE